MVFDARARMPDRAEFGRVRGSDHARRELNSRFTPKMEASAAARARSRSMIAMRREVMATRAR
jgi:hypothetical protein